MKPTPPLDTLIHTIRSQRVILDADLASLYGVATKALNQAIKRNQDRFPPDFCFQIDHAEQEELSRSKVVTTNPPSDDEESGEGLRSQIVTSKRGGRRTLPYAFTEHGALMAANVLNSPQAVKMSVYVVRAFVKQREILLAQSDVLSRLARMDAQLLKHDDALRLLWRELQPLLNPPPAPPKREIGFHVREASPSYKARKRASRPNSF